MTQKEVIDSLLKQAEEDFQTAKQLGNSKRYSYALFFGQLTLEKLFKALVIKKTNKTYPPIHSLTRLAELAEVKLTLEQRENLEEITSFNIKARYDDVKLSFYKKATKDYTQKWFRKIKNFVQWLKKQF